MFGATHQGFPPDTLVSSPTSLAEEVELEMNSSSSSSSSSFSHSSDGNSSLLDEGGSASQVPQASVEPAGYRSVVWPDSLSEWLVDGAGLQQMFCCLTFSTARALLFIASEEFGIQNEFNFNSQKFVAELSPHTKWHKAYIACDIHPMFCMSLAHDCVLKRSAWLLEKVCCEVRKL